ncbi:DUF2272 domain-containing protein [Luteimonas mephitis]|uniref:DUF2272 domain-containing protein n=1 Tax=Luteimonas mephitis TaxID=83615 RepID=UPI0012ECA419|nr:DUF2272 domain-containing protein [Luteimonas mephitis]
MKPASMMKTLLACVLWWLMLAIPGLARASDACPLLRAQVDSPVVSTRIAAAACEEHQLWYRPFIDLDGRYAGSRVREAEAGLLANGQPAWLRVVDYWRGSGLLGRASARPGASDCAYAGMSQYASPACRTFVVDTPWSAAFVSWVMARARVPGFNGSASHVSYVRDAYRDPAGNAYQVANPVSARPQPGDLLCYVRVTSRVYGFGGLAGLLSSNESGLNMHCDIVVAANPDNDGMAYLVGGNVLDGVTMRLLRLTPGGQFANLAMRVPGAPDCSPDAPSSCDASRQDWAVLLQLRPAQQLAQLPPALPMMPSPASQQQSRPSQECCVNCVVGSGIPRCPAGTQAPARPLPPPKPAETPQPLPAKCCVDCVVGSGVPRCPAGTPARP